MTIFKSRQVNLDPEPWVAWGVRYPKKAGSAYYDPRPEFEPTRDPLPWYCEAGDHRCCSAIRRVTSGQGYATHPDAHVWTWNPRRDQFDTPVNRILVHFRENTEPGMDLSYYLMQLDAATGDPVVASIAFSPYVRYAPAEIDHAHRVLTRLAALA